MGGRDTIRGILGDVKEGGLRKNLFGQVHGSPDSLKTIPQKRVEKVLRSDEDFVSAIDCKGLNAFPNYTTVLVLTDRRLVACKPKLTGHDVESFKLDKVSNVEYDESYTSAEITIHGSGFEESFDVYRNGVDEFMDEVWTHV